MKHTKLSGNILCLRHTRHTKHMKHMKRTRRRRTAPIRAADTQGKRGKKALRMTMAFSEENMDYIRTMGKLESGGADGLRQPADRGGPAGSTRTSTGR